MTYERSKDPMLAMDFWKPEAPRYSDLIAEIADLKQQRDHLERENAKQGELLNKAIEQRDELLAALKLMLNPTGLERDRIDVARAAIAKVKP